MISALMAGLPDRQYGWGRETYIEEGYLPKVGGSLQRNGRQEPLNRRLVILELGEGI